MLFFDRGKTSGKKMGVILNYLQSLHELANGHIILRSESGWLMLEVIHYQLQGLSCFILGG